MLVVSNGKNRKDCAMSFRVGDIVVVDDSEVCKIDILFIHNNFMTLATELEVVSSNSTVTNYSRKYWATLPLDRVRKPTKEEEDIYWLGELRDS